MDNTLHSIYVNVIGMGKRGSELYKAEGAASRVAA